MVAVSRTLSSVDAWTDWGKRDVGHACVRGFVVNATFHMVERAYASEIDSRCSVNLKRR